MIRYRLKRYVTAAQDFAYYANAPPGASGSRPAVYLDNDGKMPEEIEISIEYVKSKRARMIEIIKRRGFDTKNASELYEELKAEANRA